MSSSQHEASCECGNVEDLEWVGELLCKECRTCSHGRIAHGASPLDPQLEHYAYCPDCAWDLFIMDTFHGPVLVDLEIFLPFCVRLRINPYRAVRDRVTNEDEMDIYFLEHTTSFDANRALDIPRLPPLHRLPRGWRP